MKITITMIVVFGLAACSLGASPSSAEPTLEQWRSRRDALSAPGITYTVELRGHYAFVSANNLAKDDLCVLKPLWPDRRLNLDLFYIKTSRGVVKFSGDVVSIVGGDAYRLEPGQALSAKVDLDKFYALKPDEKILFVDFYSPFYRC
jgi:hypothetical protein